MGSMACPCLHQTAANWRGPQTALADARDKSTWPHGTTRRHVQRSAMRRHAGRRQPRSSRNMKITRSLALTALIAGATLPVAAQVATGSRTRTHVEILASEKFGGRDAGSEGERLAADYIASQLTQIGRASCRE